MEKKLVSSDQVIDGDVRFKLPVGFRFRPTDEELIVYYLSRKVLALSLPAVTEIDVFQSQPHDLPGDLKERRHFFSRMSRHGSDVSRRVVASGSGYWKAIGREKTIVADSDGEHLVGVRKTFVFRQIRGGSDAVKKQWVMHELRLVGLQRRLCVAKPASEEGEWAVYRVCQKKRKSTKRHRCKEVACNDATVIDLRDEEEWVPPPPSSPCSSLTMEHGSQLLVDQDEITSYIS